MTRYSERATGVAPATALLFSSGSKLTLASPMPEAFSGIHTTFRIMNRHALKRETSRKAGR